jgi:replicative DNA helicase
MGNSISSKIITLEKAVDQTISYTEKRATGEIKSLKTPLKSLNEAGVNGLEWGTIITIAGLSGSGKTAISSFIETGLFDLNPEESFAGFNLTFEMAAFKLMGRKFSSKLDITTSELYSADKEFKRLNELKEIKKELLKYEIYFLEDYTTVTGIINYVEQLYNKINDGQRKTSIHDEKGLLVILDHSILVKLDKTKENSRLEALHNLCEAFNYLKKKIKIITIILSQLNRGIEASERRDELKNQILQFPTKSDIYGGDSLYQFSDIVFIPHRPEMLNIRYYGPEKWKSKDRIFLHYLKCRESEPSITVAENLLKHNKIKEITL